MQCHRYLLRYQQEQASDQQIRTLSFIICRSWVQVPSAPPCRSLSLSKRPPQRFSPSLVSFSASSACFSGGRRRGAAITGIIISFAALVLSSILAIVYTAGFAAAVNKTVEDSNADAAKTLTLVYEVTGYSSDSLITYSTYNAVPPEASRQRRRLCRSRSRSQ